MRGFVVLLFPGEIPYGAKGNTDDMHPMFWAWILAVMLAAEWHGFGAVEILESFFRSDAVGFVLHTCAVCSSSCVA